MKGAEGNVSYFETDAMFNGELLEKSVS